MEENLDIGIVTQNGIWFHGKIYSCSLAIQQRWFELAQKIGGWPVMGLQRGGADERMYILLKDGGTIDCFPIKQPSKESAQLMSYYLELQRLLELRKELSERGSN